MVTMSFEESFILLTGYRPFGWQTRLGCRLLDSDLPQAIDIPTGLGKTSVMALWFIALAKGANLPRLLVYVVDRRVVVDQATHFAERLRERVPDDLAGALGMKENSERLSISTLRGGFADNRDWLGDPCKPAIVVGTVDMVGSRLLFEGYGVSRRMRPYHAGLLGVDTLVLLDEAHLCLPFEALLRQVAKHRDGKFGPAPGSNLWTPPFRITSLSATGRDQLDLPPDSIFTLGPEDYKEIEVRKRLKARKRLHVNTELTDPSCLPDRLADRAVELGDSKPPARIVVYCDRRKDAIKVKDLIDKKCTGHKSQLLVGERRIYERAILEKWLTEHGFLGSAHDAPDAPTFLVATSAGEVGVDLDADHMVCDLVSWERTVQRLGRVNRRGGENRSAMIDLFAVRPTEQAGTRKSTKAEQSLTTFEAQLAPLSRLACGPDNRYDASPAALVTLKTNHREIVDAATTNAPLYPELTRPLVDAWSMTSLRRHEGRPEVAPWLRGWDRDEPQTSVVWRKHLPCVRSDSKMTANAKMVTEFFRAAPIHATERLEATSSRVMTWLLERLERLSRQSSDQEIAVDSIHSVVAILMNSAGEHIAMVKLNELSMLKDQKSEWKDRLLPGATLVVDSRMCGLRDGVLDSKCKSETASADADEEWRAEITDPAAEIPRRMIEFRIEEVASSEDAEGLPTPHLNGWRHTQTFETRFGPSGVIQGGLAVFRSVYDPTSKESRSGVTAPQSLRDHANQVENRARKLACSLNLPGDEVKAITIAARLHDDGKAAERWQEAMNTPRQGRPYAKPAGGVNLQLLGGYRHEFGSLLRAEHEDLPEDIRDLVLHLIAAHHGYARPIIGHNGCEDGPPSLLESKAGEVALRFSRLQKRYGPWGLAWREAILRAADQWVSRPANQPTRRNCDDG